MSLNLFGNTIIISFSKISMEEIKNYIRQYCAEKNAAGYYTLLDPLSAYYEALCVGMEWNEGLNDDFLDTDNNSGLSLFAIQFFPLFGLCLFLNSRLFHFVHAL